MQRPWGRLRGEGKPQWAQSPRPKGRGAVSYIAGVLAAIAFSWSGMVWGSLRDLALPAEVRGDLRREMTARIAVGSLFAASAALYSVGAHLLSQAVFIVTIAVIAYRVLVGYAARLHRRRLLGQS
jgi:hypothetical protein